MNTKSGTVDTELPDFNKMSNEAMPIEFHILREQHSFLINCLEAIEISRILFSKNVISMTCLEKIESLKARPEQVGKLLEYMRSSEDIRGAFSAFCDSISSIPAQKFIAEQLEKEMTKRKTSIVVQESLTQLQEMKDETMLQSYEKSKLISDHFLGASSFLIPFMDALSQFEIYLQVLMQSKEISAKLSTAVDPEVSFQKGFIDVVKVTCQLALSPALYDKMVFEFAEMKMRLLSALKKNEDALSLMKDYIKTVGDYLPDIKTSVDSIKTTQDLFFAIQDQWNTKGVDYIRQMIKGTGCKEAVDVLEHYMHLKVPFSNGVVAENLPSKMVEVTAALDCDSLTSETYLKAKNNVSWVLCIPPSALMYSEISKGSIIIHWKLPSSLMDYVKSISLKAVNVCKPLLAIDGIIKITVETAFEILCKANTPTERGARLKQIGNPHDKAKVSILIEACKKGDIEQVKNLISEGVSFNCIDERDLSPLQAATDPELHAEVFEWLFSLGAQNSDGIHEMENLLLKACKNGDKNAVEDILKSKIDTNCRNWDGETPLILAASHGHKEIIEMLLLTHVDIDSCEKDGKSALYLACKKGYKEVVDILIANGAEVNWKLSNGATPLYIACQEGHYDIVQKLISLPRLNLHYTASTGFTALHAACINGYTDIVKLLIAAGLRINQPNDDGARPLYVASETGHAEVVKVLVENHADLNMKLNVGDTALHIASYRGHWEVAMVLITAGCDLNSQTKKGSTALFLASQNGHRAVVNLLLDAGCKVNLCNENGGSPLDVACRSGHNDIVHTLIGSNGNINHQKKMGLTALCHAAIQGHIKVVQTLIAAGADVNLCSELKFSPLHCASEGDRKDVVTLLLSEKANINMQNDEGNTSLHVATFMGHTSTVSVLIASKCDINIQNNNKTTALMIASGTGNVSCVEALIAAGANVNLKNCFDCTALHDAVTTGNKDIVKILCNSGADLNLQCKITGFTPLHIAVLSENVNIVQTLLAANAEVNSTSPSNGWTPLIAAACVGSLDIVLDLCTSNANVNIEDKFGKTALTYAVMKQYSNIAQVIIQFGANINHQLQPQGWTPLMLAAQNGSIEITQLLCNQQDIELNAVDNFGNTAMDISLSHDHNVVHDELMKRTHIQGRNAPIEVTESAENYENFNNFWALLKQNVDNMLPPVPTMITACF